MHNVPKSAVGQATYIYMTQSPINIDRHTQKLMWLKRMPLTVINVIDT